jgi:hypothetical protein
MGIFSQTAGSTCEFWVNPVNFTLVIVATAAKPVIASNFLTINKPHALHRTIMYLCPNCWSREFYAHSPASPLSLASTIVLLPLLVSARLSSLDVDTQIRPLGSRSSETSILMSPAPACCAQVGQIAASGERAANAAPAPKL